MKSRLKPLTLAIFSSLSNFKLLCHPRLHCIVTWPTALEFKKLFHNPGYQMMAFYTALIFHSLLALFQSSRLVLEINFGKFHPKIPEWYFETIYLGKCWPEKYDLCNLQMKAEINVWLKKKLVLWLNNLSDFNLIFWIFANSMTAFILDYSILRGF